MTWRVARAALVHNRPRTQAQKALAAGLLPNEGNTSIERSTPRRPARDAKPGVGLLISGVGAVTRHTLGRAGVDNQPRIGAVAATEWGAPAARPKTTYFELRARRVARRRLSCALTSPFRCSPACPGLGVSIGSPASLSSARYLHHFLSARPGLPLHFGRAGAFFILLTLPLEGQRPLGETPTPRIASLGAARPVSRIAQF